MHHQADSISKRMYPGPNAQYHGEQENNEIGTWSDWRQIGEYKKSRGEEERYSSVTST
jgi:hypothetical protein